ncbi:MAG: Imm26 family immunity protein [Bellilinea sp.]|jgi:hypothetical protein
MRISKLRVGSVFEIPLGGNRKAFGRYLHKDLQSGPIIHIFNTILDNTQEINISKLPDFGNMFPPVFVGLHAAIREGYWKIVGFIPVKNFHYPGFITAHWGGDPPKIHQWLLWDGKQYRSLGSKLPEKYKNFEFYGVYTAYDITKRIETGEGSFLKTLLSWELE